MKQSIGLLLVLLALHTATAQSRIDMTMTVDSAERHFIVVLPTGSPPPSGYALVMMFHGEGTTGEEAFDLSGWKEKGQGENFVTVFPTSLTNCFLDGGGQPVQTRRWTNGRSMARRCPGATLKDDVRFVRGMLDTIQSTFPIDPSRIYATGFSDGGTFVSKLGVEMGDLIAAIAPAFGPLDVADSATPRRNLPVSYFTGTLDEEALAEHGIASIPFSDDCLTYIGDVVQRYLGTFNLSSASMRGTTDYSITWLHRTPASTDRSWTQFSLTLWKGLTRVYPNGTNYPVAAVDFLWPYFNGHYLPAGIEPASAPGGPVKIAPNPASHHLTVNGKGPITLTIRTLLGQPVFTTTMDAGATIDLPTLPPGLYLAEVIATRSRTTSMLVLR